MHSDFGIPAVSIILPTYNRLEYLPAAVASIFEQSLQDWELLIADDGSDGATREYLDSLCGDPRVRVILLSQHTGKPGVVRNAALREARGEYIAFMDSDDLWRPSKLATQIAALRRRPERRWSHTKYVLVDEALNPTAWTLRTGGWSTPSGWVLEDLLRGNTVIALPSVVVSKGLLEEVDGFDENLVGSEDYELWLRLAIRSEIDAVDQELTLVRRHHTHFSGDSVKGFAGSKAAIEKLMQCEEAQHLRSFLRQRRSALAVGLAESQFAAGAPRAALRTLQSSASYSWRYPAWWLQAIRSVARPYGRTVLARLSGQIPEHR